MLELFPVLEVDDVDDAGDDAEEAFVIPASTIPLAFPAAAGEVLELAAVLVDVPDGEVKVTTLLGPGLPPNGAGLLRDVEVLKSWGDETFVDVDVPSAAYLQLGAVWAC